jgi:hypothetical protein
MPVVKVSAGPVLTEWRHREGRDVEFCLESTVDVDLLVRVFEPVVGIINEGLGYNGVVVGPTPYPRGVMFFVDDCDDPTLVRGILEQVGQAARDHEVDGRIGMVRSEYSPLSSHRPPGFIAGLSLRSASAGDELSGSFTPDPAAVEAITEYGLAWCHVPGGQSWFGSGLSVFKTSPEQRGPLFKAAMHSEQPHDLVSARATKLTKAERDLSFALYRVQLARTVRFIYGHHVIFGIASEEPLDWAACVDELRSLVVDLRDHVDYAMIQRTNVTPGLWTELHRECWPNRDDVPPLTVRQDRAAEASTVAGGYAIQLLGPHHHPRPAGTSWSVDDLGGGKVLVSHADPEAWFGTVPTADLLIEARQSFRDLLWDQSWKPQTA